MPFKDPVAKREYNRKWSNSNPKKIRDHKRRQRKNNPETGHKHNRQFRLRQRYGISPAEYDRLFISQGGVCAICHRPESQSLNGKVIRLAVDHDPITKQVRGLLCSRCNNGIGRMKHDPILLQSAINYLLLWFNMGQPTSKEEFENRFHQNQKVSGNGLATMMHMPCPFCAAPNFLVYKIIDSEDAMVEGATCIECGRGAAIEFSINTPSNKQFEFVQIAGDDQPEWLEPKMRRR